LVEVSMLSSNFCLSAPDVELKKLECFVFGNIFQ
jgi:hypothetical protein